MQRLKLVPIAPVCEDDPDAALRHSGSILAILNSDEKQPDSVKGSPGTPHLTLEQFIADTAIWCEQNSALSYAIVDDGVCIGIISMSHIDDIGKSCRCGWILGSKFWGRGFEDEALQRVIKIARARGMKSLGGKMMKDNCKAIGFWQNLGARFEESDQPTHWLAILDVAEESAL